MRTILKIIKEHIEYRKQIGKMAKADIVKTYRGAALRMVMGNNKTYSYYICILVCICNWIKSKWRCKRFPFLLVANCGSSTLVLYERNDKCWNRCNKEI